MIFPNLQNKRFGYANLNLEAQKWIETKSSAKDLKDAKNPLLDPEICQSMVDDVHQKYNLDFSYGGWMEDRSFLWKGSYLEEDKNFLHLGIDFNVATGTEVAATFDAEVVRIDDDSPEEGGWGPRVILKHQSEPVHLIFAHLDKEINCKAGDIIKSGQIFAKVGHAPFNGNWFAHLHLQAVINEYYEDLIKTEMLGELDGYGLASEASISSKRFPDPIKFANFS